MGRDRTLRFSMAAIHEQVHEVTPEHVFELLRSSKAGLTDAEAMSRLRAVGPNQLSPPSRLRWVRTLVKKFVNFFSILLDVAVVACFVADALQPGEGMRLLGWALLAVSLLNSLFAFVQEIRAERAMEELRRYLPQLARVRRNGREEQVIVEQLVPGDIAILSEGDRIPADVRLVESEELLVNNAPLTGESRSQPLVSTAWRGRFTESPNIAFAGCSVLRGSAVGVVFATGERTEFGKIAALSEQVRRPPSPLARETSQMIRVLTVIAVVMGSLFFAYGVTTGRPLWVNIVFMLGIIVANVPEGLLPTFTLSLSMAARRMSRRQVLVKSLEAVEALGDVHVICTDKTGTLTRNELSIAGAIAPVQGEEFPASQMTSLLKTALIASEVRDRSDVATAPRSDGQSDSSETNDSHIWDGDPMDVVIAEQVQELVGMAAVAEIVRGTRRHFPFDLQRRREAGICANEKEVTFAVKGAWESLRPLIGSISCPVAGTVQSANPQLLSQSDAIVRSIAAQGQRVIAVAHRRLPRMPAPSAPEESLEQSLTLTGFLVFDDPLRAEIPEAVNRCQLAGIQVVMITGDHPVTASAVARQCGILGQHEEQGKVILGAELESMSPEQLAERLNQGVAVFARTTPEQKLKIVSALKHLNQVVCMTGDGVNDAPALKGADVGIAMGQSGTEVAREAADIVLLDDNFASIVAGIEEGRGVFVNVQKFTTYVLSSNIPEIVPFLLFIIMPVPLALTVIQILAIDLGTDLLPAIGLGQEPPEQESMKRPPRGAGQQLLSWPVMATAYLFLGLIQAGWSLFMFFFVLLQGGWSWGEELQADDPLYRAATGITLASVVLMQIPNVIGRRSLTSSGLDGDLFRNRIILLGIAVEIAFSWAVLYLPPMQRFLGTGPVPWPVFALAWAGIPLLFILDGARKWVLRTIPTISHTRAVCDDLTMSK
jgi:sodium/potassium-transporting ATPase subunit alpha